MAYAVCPIDGGSVRLFATKEDADRWGERHKFAAGAEVNGAEHYRGTIRKDGVRFMPHDQSFAQLLAAIMNQD